MRGGNNRVNVSAHVEVCFDYDFSRLKEFNEIIENAVSNIFVKYFFVAEFINIKFEGFELHAVLIRRVGNMDGGKIGKATARANAGELWACKIHHVIPMLGAIFEAFELAVFNGDFAVKFFVHSASTSNKKGS